MRTVRKGWLFGSGLRFRVIQDTSNGLIFIRGCGGWRHLHDHERVVLLPRRIEWIGWLRADWWTPRLWRRPEWAWIYGAP